jgi:hypothetical protein
MQHINNIEVHLAEHCNLSCACCIHGCPVAEPEFPSIERFERDFEKFSELTGGNIKQVVLSGGEPLLNPDIVSYMRAVRQNMPASIIKVSTNGILLARMRDDFWRACVDNDIEISISQYPIKLNYDEIFSIAKERAVKISLKVLMFRNGQGDVFRHRKIDISGGQDIGEAYKNCLCKGPVFVKDGKVYRCAQISSSKHLEKYFGAEFTISDNDFLVLDRVDSVQEIQDFISRPSPFCRYCATGRRMFVQWAVSEKRKEEWFLEE